MRRLVRSLVVACAIALAFSAPMATAAHARVVAAPAPAPAAVATTPAASTSPTDVGDDTGTKHPWVRMWFFVPISALIGGGAVAGRRAARRRGWARD